MTCRSRRHIRAIAFLFVAVVLFGLSEPRSQRAFALIGDTPTIRDVSIVPSFARKSCSIALLGQDRGGAYQIIVRVVQDKTGAPIGSELRAPLALPPGVTAVDIRVSTVFAPDSVLVLDSSLVVHELKLGFLADGTPLIEIRSEHGPFGDPLLLGEGTALAEAPNAANPSMPFLAIGTATGHLIVQNGSSTIADLPVVAGPIQALAAVKQMGSFAFVALAPDKSGDQLIGVVPDVKLADPRPDPAVIFQLADPRPDPLLDVAGAVFEPNDEPLADLDDVFLVAADGSNVVTRLTIPADAATGGMLRRQALDPVGTDIVRLAAGSLAMVSRDGSGVLFDPGFNLNSGGISGTLLTVFGAAAEPRPQTLKLSSNGRAFNVVLELADGGAALVDPRIDSISMELNGVSIPPVAEPKLGDADGDGNKDLTIKFDRIVVIGGCPNAGVQRFVIRFQLIDGSNGSVLAVMRTMA